MHYTQLATITNILWKLIDANGHDPEALYRDAGIAPDLLKKPGARISCARVGRVWAKSTEVIDDPCFGLKGYKFWHPSYLHALGYAWLASHTLREAFNRLARYMRVVSEIPYLSLKEDINGYTVMYNLELLDMGSPDQVDVGMATLFHMCRINYGEELKLKAVTLTRAEPPCAVEYVALFKAPVQFSAARDSMTFYLADVDKHLDGTNPQLARLNDQVMIEYLGKLNQDNIIDRVTAAILDRLPSGGISDKTVAEHLNMSRRSLQRRLNKAGTTFRTILDRVRKDLAATYVHDPGIELVEVAFLLGFSDQSAFSRAFKRWTGNTPSEFRMSG